jgi:uncharacterized membrane protein (UPF0136 family)
VRQLPLVLSGIALGALTALVGTVLHQTQLLNLPLGLALSLVLVFWLGVLTRNPKTKSWGYALALSVSIYLLGSEGNQDSLIPASTLGYVWAYGSISLALLVAMFPRLTKLSASDTSDKSENHD